jgi:hypothetical protein
VSTYAAPHQGQVAITTYAAETLGAANGMLTAWDAATFARQLLASAVAVVPPPGWKPCKWCQAPIVWALTQAGSGMPFDPGDHPQGEFAARWDEHGMHVRKCRLREPLNPGERRVMTHFGTCPRSNDVPRARDRQETRR